ncbi:MAG: DUF6045 family protein [Gemmiger sp.]|nr:conjugal transfer protein TrbL family protein [Gemmiger sp.]MDY5782741.1 DUF6045 family protein [Gemmiger sp.]
MWPGITLTSTTAVTAVGSVWPLWANPSPSLSSGLTGLLGTPTGIAAAAADALEFINGPNPISSIALVILLGYSVFRTFFSNLKRGGILLVLIVVGSLYQFTMMILIIYFFCRESKMVFIVIGGFCAIPNALIAVVRTYIAPDTIDYTRYKTGKDCSGIFYSLQSFINKVLNGMVGSVTLFILALGGWQEVVGDSFADLAAQGVTQTPQALDTLWKLGYLIPAIGFTIAAILLYAFYGLKDKDAALMAQCNAGKISREECEAQLSRKY